MLNLKIPEFKDLSVDKIVLDLNGTIACDGKLISGVKEKINKLARDFDIYILTADTFGTAEELLKDLDANLEIIDSNDGSLYKANFIKKLGKSSVIAFGNGNNDADMLKEAELAVAVMGAEGTAVNAVLNADIVFRDIKDALETLMKPGRLKATLRK